MWCYLEGWTRGSMIYNRHRKKRTLGYCCMKNMPSDNGYKYVIVVSEDTDVYVLCIAFA